ncbi:17383_t:CDS:2 [Gigaspora rosea]|nr:17383_t:CDS:2 [Gigaspora rosea]
MSIKETGKNLRKRSSQEFENLQSNSESDQVTDSESEIIQQIYYQNQKKRSRKRGLIWNYYNENIDPVTKIKTDICKVIVKKGNKEVECGKEVTYNNSTSNMWTHLSSIHESIFQNASNNPKRKKEKDQALAEFIIYNSQPLTILSSQKFIVFCQALDLYYQVPNDKALKHMINEAYLYNKNLLCEILEKSALTVSLTCDLWTTRSRQGYLENAWLMEINTEELVDLTNEDTALDDIGFDCNDLDLKVQAALYCALEKYWDIPIDNTILYASLLDPWCKKLDFISSKIKQQVI